MAGAADDSHLSLCCGRILLGPEQGTCKVPIVIVMIIILLTFFFFPLYKIIAFFTA